MRYVATITGLSGRERFLADGKETDDAKDALRFKSEREAETAADQHIKAYPSCVGRYMRAAVKPFRPVCAGSK